jgi:hypothetical protein
MAVCPFKRCKAKAQNLEHLLGHVRKRHGARWWTMQTLKIGLRNKEGI